jgi:hypothetical protein
MIITILPLFANAQNFNSSQIKPQNNVHSFGLEPSPKVPEIMPTMKPLYRNRVENAKAKLAREEQKLIKLARKTWEKEADLKTKQEKLKNLENTPENSNDPNLQKNIEKCKKQIAKSQNTLDKEKIKLESRSKKVEDFELAIEEAKFKREGGY